jgi:hypothetical protein
LTYIKSKWYHILNERHRYIHGGAWRDPRVTHETFAPTINNILSTSSTNSNGNNDVIAGFASIDYRLSLHPQFPQDETKTPTFEYRGAQHPDHLDDVRAALGFLQLTYGFGSNYVLVGHSAGGALSFQLLATCSSSSSPSRQQEEKENPALPAAIVAFEGLYDFAGVNARYDGQYASFFCSAFGDPSNWAAASPIEFGGNYAEKWCGGNLLLLGWSPDDTLVDEPEADNMARRLQEQDGFVMEEEEEQGKGEGEGSKRLLLMKDLKGDHDEIWQDGEHVARMVRIALRKLGAAV